MSPKFRAYLDAEKVGLEGDGLIRMKCPECNYETRSATLRVKCPVKHKPHRMLLAVPSRRSGTNGSGTNDES